MTRHRIATRHQHGAALATGLILLFVLTVLALTGMNTASTELIMAGNEQYRQNAFQAAETGLEQAMSVLWTVNQDCNADTVVAPTNVPGSATDRFTTRSRFMGEETNLANFGVGKFSALHYRVRSTGTSSRNAGAVHEQGAYVVAQAGASESIGGLASCGGVVTPPTT